jgi:cytochrome c oxidase subunit 3
MEARTEEPTTARGRPAYLGMIFFLVSELFLFGSLFWTYFYLRVETAVWPPAGIKPDTILAGVNTLFLLAGSGVIMWAVNGLRKGKEGRLAIGLGVTALLGIVFLGITGWEWAHEAFKPWTHAYGSIFFTLTGFHALHVLGGVVFMLILFGQTLRHKYSLTDYTPVEIGSLYWHFIDFIWVMVFISIFIIK